VHTRERVEGEEEVEPSAVRVDGGLLALCAVARFHQVAADPAALSHQLGLPASRSLQIDDLLTAANLLGLKAKRTRAAAPRLALMPLPALALMSSAAGRRVVILAHCDGKRVLIQDPATGGPPAIESVDAFAAEWTGELILVASRASIAGQLARFDFSWFIPSLVKYRKLFGEVLLVSLFLQLFALVSPLFFQVVMDKVLVHRGVTTLDVLVIGLVIVVVFESLLSGLRSYEFGRGDGQDTIVENDDTAGVLDKLHFDAGIAADQLWWRKSGNSLEVSVIGSTDKVTLSNWYLGAARHVEVFELANGSQLLDTQVQALVQAMASFSPPAAGQASLPANYESTLQPVIAANWH
jgi:hypothetical protein